MPRPCKQAEPAHKPQRRTIDKYIEDNPGMNRRTVYRLADRGKIRLIKAGGEGRIFVEETAETWVPVVRGEYGKAVTAMLAAKKAKAEKAKAAAEEAKAERFEAEREKTEAPQDKPLEPSEEAS
jgi:hypothetical protein